MRLAGVIKGGYYPTPLRCIDLLAEHLRVRHRPPTHNGANGAIRILDPCCGPGDACERLAMRLASQTRAGITTFGVELEQERAEQARQQLGHLLSADLFRTQIANNAFHVLFLNPPYDYDQEDKRVEHAFLNHCTRYLEEDGLLIFIVPRHRLEVSARYLASHYCQVSCHAFPMPEYDDFDQVILTGNRLLNPEHNMYQEKLILDWSQRPYDAMPRLDDAPEGHGIRLATGPSQDLLFTIRTVDPFRAAQEARRSGLWASHNLQESLWPDETRGNQPLMPLRQGHMATLIAAGFLDNLTLEAEDGSRVIVKGRTVKRLELVEENEQGEIWQDRMYTTIRMLDLDDGAIWNVETKSGRQTRDSISRAGDSTQE